MALTKNKTYERGPLLLLKAAYLASYIDKHKLGDIVDRRLQAANWQTGNRQPATGNCELQAGRSANAFLRNGQSTCRRT